MQKKHYLIYKTTNLVNGKIYIGKHETDNLDDGYLGSGNLLRRAIKKYGEKNFKREILFECSSREEMNAKETELVNEDFLNRDDVYNIKLGGQGGWDYVIENNLHRDPKNHSIGGQAFAKKLKEDEEFRLKVSENIRKAWREHPEKYVNAKKVLTGKRYFLGIHHSDETKQKIGYANSRRQQGKNNVNYGKQWVSDTFNELCYSIDKSVPLEEYQLPTRILDFNKYKEKNANDQMNKIQKIEHQMKRHEIQQTFFSAFYDEYLRSGFNNMCQKFGMDFEISAFLHLCKKRVPYYSTWNRWKQRDK